MSNPKGRHSSRVLKMAVPAQDMSRGRAAPVDADILIRMEQIDQAPMLRYRLERFRTELRKRELFDPLNLRYATGTRNMAVWTTHAPTRCAFVAANGPVILFEFASSRHVTDGSPIVDEVRPCVSWIYFLAGPRTTEKAHLWADEIESLLRRHGGKNRRLAVDRCDPLGAARLRSHGVELFDAQEPAEQARMIKSSEEIACIQSAMEVCDFAVGRMREARCLPA
jgi:Xaa-Pro aminopeptidase